MRRRFIHDLVLVLLGAAACSSSCGAGMSDQSVALLPKTTRNDAGTDPVYGGGANDAAGDSNTPGRPTIVGGHTVVYQAAGQGTSPMTTNGMTTQKSGSSVVVCAGVGTNYGRAGTISISDNMGNTYRQVGSNVFYAGDQGTTSMYVSTGVAGGPNHKFSMTKANGFTDYESTMFVVEIRGTSALDDYVEANAQSSPLSAGSVKTTETGDALVMCAFAASYSSPDHYTPSPGYTLLDEQTSGTVAMAGASAAGLAKAPGSYAGTMTSSLAKSGAIFFISLRR